MAIQPTYPGVYIDEFTPGAPIVGVGTSTAAFLGPAASGPPNEAVKLTSWDAFKQLYGSTPLTGFFLWYAVRGFFQNGGTVCYIVRVSNAAYAHLDLLDIAHQIIHDDPAHLRGGLIGIATLPACKDRPGWAGAGHRCARGLRGDRRGD